jgi:uncharacterized protein (DUF1501 family)
VIFLEFRRRVKDNENGTAASMFIIGGSNKGNIIGNNSNLSDLLQGDLKPKIDFRSLFANSLPDKLNFNLTSIVIKNPMLYGLF